MDEENYNKIYKKLSIGSDNIMSKIDEKTINQKNKNENGRTFLMSAVQLVSTDYQMGIGMNIGKNKIIKNLLKKGADPNIQDDSGKTALMIAVSHSRCDKIDNENIVELIEKTDINLRDMDGNTALMFAVKSGKEKLVDLLLEKGKDINLNLKNNDGKTALMIAAESSYNIILKLIPKTTELIDEALKIINSNTGYSEIEKNTLKSIIVQRKIQIENELLQKIDEALKIINSNTAGYSENDKNILISIIVDEALKIINSNTDGYSDNEKNILISIIGLIQIESERRKKEISRQAETLPKAADGKKRKSKRKSFKRKSLKRKSIKRKSMN